MPCSAEVSGFVICRKTSGATPGSFYRLLPPSFFASWIPLNPILEYPYLPVECLNVTSLWHRGEKKGQDRILVLWQCFKFSQRQENNLSGFWTTVIMADNC